MGHVLSWLLVVEAVGVAALPVSFLLFSSLRERGWGFARPIGLVLTGYATWILSYTGLIPNSRPTYVVVLVVVAAAGWVFMYRRRRDVRTWISREWRTIVACEAIFLVMFAVWTLYRAYDPSITGTEKPMDFMFLNASVAARHAPPIDPWLAGQPVAYYYFGYWIFGGISILSGVPTYVAFNLALASIAAMAAAAVFSLAFSLVSASAGSRRAAIWSAAAAVVLLVFAANLAGVWELASLYHIGSAGFFKWLGIDGISAGQAGEAWRPGRFWWWWAASRVINSFDAAGMSLDYTIEEFPFFSFLLGDLHPHVMSLPFFLTGIGVATNLFLSPARWGWGWLRRNPISAVLIALLLGALGFINAWDIATIAALLVLVVVFKAYRHRRISVPTAALRALPPLAVILVVALAAYAPFYFGTFSSQVQPGQPIGPVRFPTRPIHFVTVWGLWIVLLAPFLAASFSGPVLRFAAELIRPGGAVAGSGRPVADGAGTADVLPRSPLWLVTIALALPFFFWAPVHLVVSDGARPSDLALRFVTLLPLGVLVLMSSVTVVHVSRRRAADGRSFALLLSLLAAYLLYGVELIYIHDLFGNRMNTVFKVYYQLWLVFSVMAAVAIHFWISRRRSWTGWRRGASLTAGGLAAVLALFALWYPVAAALTRAGGTGPTLDGLAYLGANERAAVEWLRSHANNGDVMVEAVGGDYSEFGRVSSSTGVPTVVDWPGHERQWRGASFDTTVREADVRAIYVTEDVAEARRLLDKYDVRYVFVGARERSAYPGASLEKFDQLGHRAEFGDIEIFDLQEVASD